jgi:hypothetical protein
MVAMHDVFVNALAMKTYAIVLLHRLILSRKEIKINKKIKIKIRNKPCFVRIQLNVPINVHQIHRLVYSIFVLVHHNNPFYPNLKTNEKL